MPRPRVLSFMTAWSSPNSDSGPNSPTRFSKPQQDQQTPSRRPLPAIDTATSQSSAHQVDQLAKSSPAPSTPGTPSRARADSRASIRPESMVQTYQPPQVDVAQDTPPELAPIFSYLNSHSNKLYQEGYFLKLHDLDSRGRPSSERIWVECFAQLVGTVLSLWDAAALDAAGEDGEVVPTFINLSDASLKMIESLPMSGAQGGSLQNVLSISTAANNRYLLHFNSYNSLTQWTAGIRLAMFEHATLQEAYTGSLIAGKGRFLNNIKMIMERSRFAHEDWARVRFGAGTPWKRCWCVVSPPDEKDFQKAQKTLKKSAYDRTVKIPKGDIKFYDTRKVTKKTRPIATVTDAYAAYAIYPQSKPLIDQSTLVKLEGLVTVHNQTDTTSEGFVFVMPEVHAAVSGFEMMLRWLFPVYDTFALYGRPTRLIADTLDQRGLMFALPQDRRYGYLDILDVGGLIHAPGSHAWSERQWRKEMKKLTSERMATYRENGLGSLRHLSQRRNTVSRTSLPGGNGGVRFDDGSDSSAPPSRNLSPLPRKPDFGPPRRTDSAPPTQPGFSPHKRAASEIQGYRKHMAETPSRLSYESGRPEEDDIPPAPPRHGGALAGGYGRPGAPGGLERIQSEAEVPTLSQDYSDMHTPAEQTPSIVLPVASPPSFQHNPGARPANSPAVAPELRRAHSNVDEATLHQMHEATRGDRTPEEDYANGTANNRVILTILPIREPNVSADKLQGVVSHEHETKPMQSLPSEPKHKPDAISGHALPDKAGGETDKVGFGDVVRADNVDGHYSSLRPRGVRQQQQTQQSQRQTLPPMQSSHSISRKPAPQSPPTQPPEPFSDDEPPVATAANDDDDEAFRLNSLQDAFIDQDALDRMLEDERTSTMHSAASTEPDYASTVSSHHEERKPVERPRAGKLKTVGNPDLPQDDPKLGRLDTWQEQKARQDREMPTIDFGPTYAYKPSSRPGTSGTLNGVMHDRSRSRSQDRLRNSGRLTPSGISPVENNRLSYFGSVSSPHTSGGATPNDSVLSRNHSRTQSVAWTPSGGSPGRQQRQSLTPEQWVQYRAAMASQPQNIPPRGASPAFAHHRTASIGSTNANQLRKSMTKTPPPFSRTPSGDWTQQQQSQLRKSMSKTPPPFSRARTPSGDWAQQAQQKTPPPPRPLSRSATAYLAQPTTNLLNSSANHSAALSAREQMHVARATGTPLLDLSANARRKTPQHDEAGLVGAIGARERDKAAMKAGHRSSLAVESAIRARQDQQRVAEAEYWQQQQQLQMQQQSAWYAQQQQQAAYGYGGFSAQSPGVQYGYGYPQQQQQQQQQQQVWQQQQQQSAQTPGSRQSWFGGSYFGPQGGR